MSNKTPKEQPKGTASAPKNKVSLVVALLLTTFVVILGIYITTRSPQLSAPNGKINLEFAKTQQERTLGLSGRTGLEANQGLLFEFDETSQQNCFWMKDMLFSIDMVWLDENKSVINVIPDVAPETFPESFCPTEPAKYGLEIASGQSKVLGIEPAAILFW